MSKTANMTTSELLFPNGGWDVHHHIFEPSRFPYAPNRHLTPPPASIHQYLEFKDRLGITHSALTHGLSYGDDCSSLMPFISELGASQTRGIGVIDPDTVTAKELQKMHRSGIRGIRVNLYRYGAMHEVELQKLALRNHLKPLALHCPDWSMAFTHIHPEFWDELVPLVEREIAPTGIQLVTDHFALLKGASTLPVEFESDITKQPGFSAVMRLVRAGHLWVKISAPYRVSDQAPCFDDLRPLVEALVNANPHRIPLGSDWPHTPRMKVRTKEEALTETPYLEVDDIEWLKSLKSWLSGEVWDAIMVRNPQNLYTSNI